MKKSNYGVFGKIINNHRKRLNKKSQQEDFMYERKRKADGELDE